MTARWPPLPSMLSLLLVLLVAAGSIISLTSACEPYCNVPPTPPSPPPPAPCPPPPSPPPIVYYSSPPPPPYYPSPKPPKHSPPTPTYPTTSPPSGGGTPSANLGCCVIIPQGTLYPVDPGYKPSGAAKDEMQGRLAAGVVILLLTLALWGWW